MLGLLASHRGSRFIYKVEDLYPDIAVELGAVSRDGLTDRVLSRLSSRLLSHADTVVTLDQAMADVVRHRGARKVEIIPNWADGQAISPDSEAGRRFREEHGLEGRFIVLYSGNLGLAHRFDAVCTAAQILEGSDSHIMFLFVGDGPRLFEVKQAAGGLTNVRFLPYQPRENLRELYNAADMHLLTLRHEAAGLLVPSKYAAALGAGKPVLMVGGAGADLFKEIEIERVGWAVDHDDAQIISVLNSAAEGAESVSEFGERARKLFDRKYSREICTHTYFQLVVELTNDRTSRFELTE
jgi:glycosyltransferase involved in cell wall biosynthesis